ncbi:hypothetical protein FDK38_005272 [Candidozyma auris]|nr:hypothetical protein FDK38_005272 [[Candida] auris]
MSKHRSLKDLFRNSSSSSLNKLGHSSSPSSEQSSTAGSAGTSSNHRSFLRRWSSKSSITPQTSSSPGQSPAASDTEDKKEKSSIFHRRKNDGHQHHHSHLSLKRFFKILRPEHLDGDDSSVDSKKPPSLPLSSTSNLAKKYDMGKLIGTGASGSVNLVTSHDNSSEIFAVKKFRAKLKNEKEHDYQTKVKNEFLIGDYLKHQNLIHTMELIKEKNEFLIVMEYCPYDFFNLVMSGLMKEQEICCYFKQIINGVAHLHEAGIAHRDLKLDNCVVNQDGILKLIDFGSAFQYRKDSEGGTKKILKAKGIVGSDPYLAPEVFDTSVPYDARLADVWSIAIIFCCMILKRFPWKIPRSSDPSFRSFAGLNNMDEPVSEQEMQEHDSKGPKYGPDRLLRSLPKASQSLIKGMLTIDCSKRYLIGDVLADPFYSSIQHCYYAEVDEEVPQAEPQASQVSQPPPETPDGADSGAHTPQHVPQPNIPMSPEAGSSPASGLQSPVLSGSATPVMEGSSSEVITHEHEHRFGSHIHDPEALAGKKVVKKVDKLFKAPNHKHHLVTEQELEKINQERQRARRMKENGVA